MALHVDVVHMLFNFIPVNRWKKWGKQASKLAMLTHAHYQLGLLHVHEQYHSIVCIYIRLQRAYNVLP